jgi:hypothetical protein
MDFRKTPSNTKYNENPSNLDRVFPCGQTDRQTTNFIVAFRNYANAPEKVQLSLST